jgi:hypothetical protein
MTRENTLEAILTMQTVPNHLPEPRLLLGPGPSPVHPRVLAALGRPPIGYLDPELFTILADIQNGLRALFQTQNEHTFALTGTGMAGMEFCLANLIEPGETVVIAVNGFFGGRMCEIAERVGAKVVRVDHPWGRRLIRIASPMPVGARTFPSSAAFTPKPLPASNHPAHHRRDRAQSRRAVRDGRGHVTGRHSR